MVRHSQVIKRTLAAIVVTFALGGCANLRINVAVMDPERFRLIQARLDDDELVRQAVRGDTTQLQIALSEMCAAYKQGRVELYELQLKAQNAALAGATGTPAVSSINSLIVASQAALDDVKNKDARAGCVAAPGAPGLVDEADLVNRFRHIGAVSDSGDVALAIGQYRHALDSATRRLSTDLALVTTSAIQNARNLRPQQPDKAQEVERGVQDAVAAANSRLARGEAAAAVKGYLGANGRNLVLSDLAYAATQEPKSSWARQFNYVKGFGVGGSTDMVVKLDDTADFTMKGLVFDARAAAGAVRKVTALAVQILAAGSGMPVSVPATDGKAGFAISTDAITAAKSRIAAAEQIDVSYRASIQTLAAAFIAAAETTKTAAPDPKQIQAGRDRAKKTFEALTPSLVKPTG